MSDDNPYAPPPEGGSRVRPPRRYSTEEVQRARRTRAPAIFGCINLAVAALTLASAVVLVIADRHGAAPARESGQLTALAGILSALALLLAVSGLGLVQRRRWAAGMAKVWFVATMATLALAAVLGISRGQVLLFAGAFAVGIYACVYGVILMVAVNKRHVRAALDR